MVEVEKAKAKQRQSLLNGKSQLTADSPTAKDKGEVRSIIADKVGFKSGRDAEMAMSVVKKIKELEENGDVQSEEKVEVIKHLLNKRNPSAAEELCKWLSNKEYCNNFSVQEKSLEYLLPLLKIDDINEMIKRVKELSYNNGYKNAQKDICKALGLR